MSDSTISVNLGAMNEYTFEIRFKPNSKVLDFRGKWAESFSSKLNLPHWRITENRIDIHDEIKLEDSMERGFISFRNAGYVMRNCPSGNHFYDKTQTVLKYLFDRTEVFDKRIMVERVGVRTKFGSEFVGEFEVLLDLYLKRYVVPNDAIGEIFDADITDFGANFNFKVKSGEIEMTTMTGPMSGEQLKKFFPFVDDLPETVLYFEIDSSIKPLEEFDYFRLKNVIDRLIRNNWSINNKVAKLIAGD